MFKIQRFRDVQSCRAVPRSCDRSLNLFTDEIATWRNLGARVSAQHECERSEERFAGECYVVMAFFTRDFTYAPGAYQTCSLEGFSFEVTSLCFTQGFEKRGNISVYPLCTGSGEMSDKHRNGEPTMAYAATSQVEHIHTETALDRFKVWSRKAFDALIEARKRSAMARIAPYLANAPVVRKSGK